MTNPSEPVARVDSIASQPTSGPSPSVGSFVDRTRSEWRIRHVAETGSTNADLAAAAARGAPDRSVLVADHQTAGRGRLDRRWDAPAGTNLLASILLSGLPAVPAAVTQCVGLAIVEGVRTVLSDSDPSAGPRRGDVRLKWPNDVVVGDAKLAGVLAQLVATPDGHAVVVGFGVNVGWAPPGAVRVMDLLPTAHAGTGSSGPPTVAHVLDRILDAYDAVAAHVDAVRERYRTELATLGRAVRVVLPGGGEFVGVATDVDRDGRLVVTADGTARTFDVGDIVHLRAR